MPTGAVDEFDIPLSGLPPLSHVKFERTHLEGAAAEVRLIPVRPELAEADAVRVWEGLGGGSVLPIFERQMMNLLSLTVTPNGHQQTQENQAGWVLASADRSVSITLYASLVAVQTTQYDHYRVSLGDPLRQVLALFVEATGASVVNRIGLRFINRLQDPSARSPKFWAGHIQPAFAGPLTEGLAPLVEASHQQTQLRLDGAAAARIISGVFREEGPLPRYSFLVDLDVFAERALSYDAAQCANVTRQLNRTALALFAHVVTPSHLVELGPVPVEE